MSAARSGYDVAVIGGGVIGCAIAEALSRHAVKAVLLEACADLAAGASCANSGIVHAGYDCRPGSVMARMNVPGNAAFAGVCERLGVPFRRVGSLVLAFDGRDLQTIEGLLERGLKNGVPGLEIIGRDRIEELAPRVSAEALYALYAPTAGITSPYELTFAYAENAKANGVEIVTEYSVSRVEAGESGYTLFDGGGARPVSCRVVINAAGVFADDVARMAGVCDFTVRPRKGEYLLFDKTYITDMVIFQAPNEMGKGVLVSPTVHGNAYAGPTAADCADKRDKTTTAAGLAYIRKQAARSVPGLPWRQVITSFAGVRAIADGEDFIIRRDGNFIQAAGICSPGLSSAPAIAEFAAGLCGEVLELKGNGRYTGERQTAKRFAEMGSAERAEAIAQDPKYGNVVCRCETITEAEIIDAIKRGARTVDAVKRRVRAGMGRCQGGFCAHKVMALIAEHTGADIEAVTKSGGGSVIITGKNRGASNRTDCHCEERSDEAIHAAHKNRGGGAR